MDCSKPNFPVLHHLPELTQTHVHWVDDAIQKSGPLLSLSPTAFYLSQYQDLFQWIGSLYQVTQVLEPHHQFFQRNPRADLLQNGLIGFPCSPRDIQQSSPTPQLESINSLALSLFTVHLSHPYMTIGKTIALTVWISVGTVRSLLFNMVSRLVIAFLPRSKCLLISWLQSPSAVILEPPQNKVCHCFHCFPTYLPWSDENFIFKQ